MQTAEQIQKEFDALPTKAEKEAFVAKLNAEEKATLVSKIMVDSLEAVTLIQDVSKACGIAKAAFLQACALSLVEADHKHPGSSEAFMDGARSMMPLLKQLMEKNRSEETDA